MNEPHHFRHVLMSTMFWAFAWAMFLFLSLMFIRPVLHLLGLIFGLLGGQGLDGTDL